MRSRGDIHTLMVVVLIAALLVLAAFFVGQWRGEGIGETRIQAKWAKSKLDDIAAGQARDRAVLRELDQAHERAAGAEKVAAETEAKWKEAVRANRSKPLGSCENASPPDTSVAPVPGVAGQPAGRGPGQDGVAPDRPRGVRLLWRFVGLHDGAFTGLDGKPLFGDSSVFALDDSRADAPSPYGLDELLEASGENARALSSCRRAYQQALDGLDAAAAAWERPR